MKRFTSFFSAALLCTFALVPDTFAQIATNDAAMAEQLRLITNRSSVGLAPEVRPDGSIMVDLKGRFKYAMLAQIGDNGQPVVGCVASLKEANSFFGRNLETGESIAKTGRRFDAPVFDAKQHGMTEAEFQFYKRLIEAYEEQRALDPTAATITIVNEDGPGEGFNDPSPANPEGGNNGTTLGQQRLNLFNAAAAIWGSFLDSTVNIEVGSSFDPLPCDPNSGVLGAASTTTLHGNFPNAGFFNTWHHQALANKQSGVDRSVNPDISATFNSSLNGNAGCLGGQRFYLGLDNSTPFGTNNLLIVLLHEMGHGLGFADFIDPDTGELFNGFPDVYTTFLFDRTTSKLWNEMTDGERFNSARNNNNVVWSGKSTTIGSTALTNGRDPLGRVEVYTPNPYDGGSSIAHWNTRVSPSALMEPFITLNLPLTLDLTRQHMRDVGWYRDSDGNGTPDTITNVTPSGGFVLIGSQATINWANNGGFNRNVAVELSLDGGVTYPTVLAANIANSGTLTFTVPNTPTAQAKVRIREVSFASPVGESAANVLITATAPPTDSNAIVDFDGDGKTDISIFRPAPGEWWYLRSSNFQTQALQFGSATDKPAPADYTGDGKADITFWRPSTGEWFVIRSEDSTFFALPYGTNGDTPVPADYDGDGKVDFAVVRPSTNTWFIRRSTDGSTLFVGFGIAGDKPVTADYDGDGKSDVAIYRPSGGEWWYLRSSDGSGRVFQFGTPTDKPVPGDYTDDGKDDIAVWRPTTGEWFILRSQNLSFFAFPFGLNGDLPSPGDYDGDGETDAAVFRPSNNTWYIRGSTSGFGALAFGTTGDQPLPGGLVR